MLNISNIINEWVEQVLRLPFTIENDQITDETKDGACLRYDPAPAAERRYGDDTRLISWNMTYYIRCKKAAKARAYAYDITNRLDGETIPDPDTQTKLEIEAQTTPQFIEKDDKGFTTYSAAIVCTYLEEN